MRYFGLYLRDNRLIRFLLVGVSNTLISYLVFLLAYNILFVGNSLFSQPLSYSAGIVWSYFWNRKWTFQSNSKVRQEFAGFVTIQFLLLLLSTLMVYLIVDTWNANATVGWVLVMTFITILNFLLTKEFVFRS